MPADQPPPPDAAGSSTNSVEIFDDPGPPVSRAQIGLAVGAAAAALAGAIPSPARPLLWMIVLLLGAILLTTTLLRRGRRGMAATPLVSLHAAGFTCRGLDRMVPWLAVERVRLAPGGLGYLYIRLSAMTILPRSRAGWRTQVSRRHRTITLMGVRPRGMTRDQMMDLIERHWRAATRSAAEPSGYSAILSQAELDRLLEGGRIGEPE